MAVKKSLIIIALLLSLTISVYAYKTITKSTVRIYEGWNILTYNDYKYGFSATGNGYVCLGETVYSIGTAKAIFVYNVFEKEYIQLTVGETLDTVEGLTEEQREYLKSTPMWVYMDELPVTGASYCEMEVSTTDEFSLTSKQLYAGWNFVAPTYDFLNKSFEDMAGDCNILRLYVFLDGEWRAFPADYELVEESVGPFGFGYVMKVENDCKMYEKETINPPPALPE